jgi:hypothetical protein
MELRSGKRFQKNARMNLVMSLLSKKKIADLRAIGRHAAGIRSRLAIGGTI